MFAYKPFKETMIEIAPWVTTYSTGHALTEWERHKWALDGLRIKLDIENKIIRGLKIDLTKTEDYDQAYGNSPQISQMTRFWFDVSYEQELWDGPREGCQIVHKRIIKKEVIDKPDIDFGEIWRFEEDCGRKYVQKRIPEAVYRLGCYCCHGDGPNLEINRSTLSNGDYEIVYSVDFDFEAPNQED